jgi:hypothetical protein
MWSDWPWPGELTAYETIDRLLGCAPCLPTFGVTT